MNGEKELESILIHTYHADNALRHSAEEALNNFIKCGGAIVTLLNFIGNVNNAKELRQATCIVVKNNLRGFWDPETSEEKGLPMISLEEREYVKTAVVAVLFQEKDNSIKAYLAEIVRLVTEFEFPANWPALIPVLVENIQSSDVLRVYNSLLALRKVVKRFEYKSKENRLPLHQIIHNCFPVLEQLMTNILPLNSEEAAHCMRLTLKILWSSTSYALPPANPFEMPPSDGKSFPPVRDMNLWFNFISEIMNKVLPEASEGLEPVGQPVEIDQRKQWPWWKLKKWAARIMSQYIQRYGNPRYCDGQFKVFSEQFRNVTSVTWLGPAMNNLAIKATGGFITDDVHRMCLSYVASCVEMSPPYKAMKPHIEYILFSVVFPTMCLTDADLVMFSEEPVEFVRKVYDPLGDWLDPFVAATNLLQALTRYRQKDTLPKMIQFVQTALTEFHSLDPSMRDYRKKDACLATIAVMTKILQESKDYNDYLAPFLTTFVLPEFDSPVAFLRSRACWVIEYFGDFNWEMNDGAVLQAVLKGLLKGLRDPALPVQAAAACSSKVLIELEAAKPFIQPILPELIGEIFRIMDEVENESVLDSLGSIIENYKECLGPMAPQMVDKLVESFSRFSAATEDDDESAMNACQCLDLVRSVLESVEELPETYGAIEAKLLPLLHTLLSSEKWVEYIDNTVSIISFLTYCPETIGAGTWSLAGPLLQCLGDWAIDYIGEIMVPLLNYMSKDIRAFMTCVSSTNNQPLTLMLLDKIGEVYKNTDDYDLTGRDVRCASTLLTCLITCGRDLRDDPTTSMQGLLPPILTMVITKMQAYAGKAEKFPGRTATVIKFLEVIMAAIYYDPVTTLAFITSNQADEGVFVLLFDTLLSMEQDFTHRLVVLSFSTILTQPPGSLPPILRNNLQAMFNQLIRECVLIEEEAQKEGNEEEDEDDDDEEIGEDDDDDEEEDDDQLDDEEDSDGSPYKGTEFAKKLYVPDGGYNEDEDCLNAEDEEYREVLKRMEKKQKKAAAAALAAPAGGVVGGDEDDDMYGDCDFLDDEDVDEFSFVSPIENMDVTSFFLNMLGSLSASADHVQVVQGLQAGLSQEDKARLQELASMKGV